MIARATLAGLRLARANTRLALTLWLVNLALALAAAVPGVRAIQAATGRLPAADPLAEAFSFAVVFDLVELRPGLLDGLRDAAWGVFALGLLVGLVVAAGSLEVLTSADERPFAHRFGRGAFRFFGRFLRLAAATLVLASLATLVVAGPLLALSRQARRESGSEWLWLALVFAALASTALVALVALLVQDAARILVVRGDARGVLRALRAGAALVLRRPATWLLTWAANAALLALALGLYLAVSGALPSGGGWLVALVALQQLFVFTRCGLRVALLGAEVALVPPPAEPAAQPGPAVEPSVVPSVELPSALPTEPPA